MQRWTGRVALVTGASVGIGASVARRLVMEGMKVVGVSRNIEAIQAMAEELKGQPGSLTAIKCDVTKDDQVLSMFAKIKRDLGGVDVCINNAGMSHNHSLLEGTPEEWREMLDVNVVGLCLCTREAVASMRERGVDDGHVIHVSSIAGHRVVPRASVHFYCATKHAVNALTEGLRQELREAKSHIRISCISPGVVETEFAVRMLRSEEQANEMYSSIKCLSADDITASVIHMLAAPPHVQIHDMIVRPTEQTM